MSSSGQLQWEDHHIFVPVGLTQSLPPAEDSFAIQVWGFFHIDRILAVLMFNVFHLRPPRRAARLTLPHTALSCSTAVNSIQGLCFTSLLLSSERAPGVSGTERRFSVAPVQPLPVATWKTTIQMPKIIRKSNSQTKTQGSSLKCSHFPACQRNASSPMAVRIMVAT